MTDAITDALGPAVDLLDELRGQLLNAGSGTAEMSLRAAAQSIDAVGRHLLALQWEVKRQHDVEAGRAAREERARAEAAAQREHEALAQAAKVVAQRLGDESEFKAAIALLKAQGIDLPAELAKAPK